MASGSLDANGVWNYGEDDPASPFSDLLDLLGTSTSLQFGSDRARIAALEGAIESLTTDSGWITVGAVGAPPYTFPTVWSGYNSGGWTATAFRRVGGIINIGGVSQKSTAWVAGESVFQFPPGYRPTRRVRLVAEVNGTLVPVTIETDGTLRMQNAGGPNTVAFSGSFAL